MPNLTPLSLLPRGARALKSNIHQIAASSIAYLESSAPTTDPQVRKPNSHNHKKSDYFNYPMLRHLRRSYSLKKSSFYTAALFDTRAQETA